jgi:hypothetical protein
MDITALQVSLREVAAELLRLAEHASIPLHAGSGDKTHVLVDWENVQPDEADCRALVPDATDVCLFHGPNQKNIGRGYETFGERVTPVRIARTGKNALDFHLAFYMGHIAAKHPGSPCSCSRTIRARGRCSTTRRSNAPRLLLPSSNAVVTHSTSFRWGVDHGVPSTGSCSTSALITPPEPKCAVAVRALASECAG